MVLVFPGASSNFQGLDLTQTHQFLFCRLRKKAAAPAPSYHPVNLRGELLRNYDMSAFGSQDGVASVPEPRC